MEGNLSSRDVSFALQEAIRVDHHHQQLVASQRQGSAAPLVDDHTAELNKVVVDKAKWGSEEDEADEIGGSRKGKKASSSYPWQRVKWIDEMVRLLITAVSYINEEVCTENSSIIGSRRKHGNMQKKGKWKSVSKVLAERGFFVSPQQCEDKFNDLNKRYKRLNEILGRGTCCEVVENPSLLDMIQHVSGKAKDEARKILSSKHLHYEEMCSYHNGNRLHLPPDPELQHSLLLALGTHEEHDTESEYDYHEEDSVASALNPSNTNIPIPLADKICDHQMETSSISKKDWIGRRSVQLEDQRLDIETRMLQFEKESFKWQRFSWKKTRELEVAKMDIERMKLANERMKMELRRKELEMEMEMELNTT